MPLFHEATLSDKIYKTKKDRKKTTNESEETLAIKEIQSILSRKRPVCGCEAQSHELVANCLNCGRLTCTVEGPGECFHCGNVILSQEQQARIGKYLN